MRKLILLSLLLAACRIDAPDYSADDGGDDIDAQVTDVTLTITLGGNSVGTVTAPEGINCGADCTLTVPAGTTVTLTATPEASSRFTGWSGGGCTGTEPCELTLTTDTTVEAAFDLSQFTLTVTPGGNGTGTITADPIGIDCGVDCTEDYDVGTPVTLTATPEVGSTFVGWTGGGCSGTDPCVVEVTAAIEVQASFALDNSIIVTLAGNGTGGVTSNPGGITCRDDCSEAYGPGTMVTLTALATGDSVFDGWDGGGCSGTGTCQVTTDDAVLVTATFILNQHTLDVVRTGTGTGLVTSNPIGIDCGLDCSQAYDSGTPVTLTALPTTGKFAGWTGDCSGLGNCNTVLGLDRSVTATFTLITVGNVTSTTGNGIYSNPTSIPILLTFSDPVVVTGAPTLALDTGGVATYASGSGSNTLSFTYVVAAGQASSDLDYAATTSLALAGGTIRDGLGNNATLTLPIPGAAGSLGGNKAIVIDAVAPVVSAITGPVGTVSSTGATLNYTVNELHPGTTTCTQTVGTGAQTVCDSTRVVYSGLSEGAHTVTVIHTDTAGNVSSAQQHAWTVDTTPPDTTISTALSGTVASNDPSFAFTASPVGGTFQCRLDGAAYAACTSPRAFTDVADGAHTFSVYACDAVGNCDPTPDSRTWTVDTTPPDTTISTALSGTVASNDPSFAFTASPVGGTFQCRLDGAAYAACTSPRAFTDVADGAHTFSVYACDAVGNCDPTPAARSWTVDTIAPVVSVITSPPNPTTSTTATLSYVVTDTNPGSTACNQTAGTGTQTGCTNTSATYTGLSSGWHTVHVTHTDLAGNVSGTLEFTWSVCSESTVVFSTATAGTTFTVPAGCATRMDVYAWGAGGGGGTLTGNSMGSGQGGGGGFAGATLAVASGSAFLIAVGGGGGTGSTGGSAGTNDGAVGGAGNGTGGGGGGGGGWSGVFAGSIYFVVAAGGGGGGTHGASGIMHGGSGGGLQGDAGDGNDFGGSGGGGTQATGGSGGSWPIGPSGTAGGPRQGGRGGNGISAGGAGGGGGGGYFGGGGGGGGGPYLIEGAGTFQFGGGGGGGGSSFAAASLMNGTTVAGSSTTPGNTASPFYEAPRGVGGGTALPGNRGKVVIVLR